MHSGLPRPCEENANKPATGTDCHGLVYWQAGVEPIREPLPVSSGSPTLIKPRQGRRRPLGKCSSYEKKRDHLGIQNFEAPFPCAPHECTRLFGLYGPQRTRWNYCTPVTTHGKLESLSPLGGQAVL